MNKHGNLRLRKARKTPVRDSKELQNATRTCNQTNENKTIRCSESSGKLRLVLS